MEENETVVVLTHDIHGKLITNSAGEPITLEVPKVVLTQGVEDLGELGPVGRAPVDLNKTPRQLLNGITRMGLAMAAMEVTSSRPMPVIARDKHPGSAKRLQPIAHGVPTKGSGGRVGRNELCHCGSGKKFGKCCLEKLKNKVS